MHPKTLIVGLCGAMLVSITLAEPTKPQAIFNGKNLDGWSGQAPFWSVEDGTITGRSTLENPVEANTFLIFDQPVADFEFRAEFKLTGETSNSGIQYRSQLIDPENRIVGGYQADMDYANRYTGMLYEERGRGILVRPGLRLRIGPDHADKSPDLTPLDGPPTAKSALKTVIRQGRWNEIQIIARGNHVRHFVNGVLTAEFIDEDPDHAAASGVLALQLHRGPPMTVQFRNLKLSPLL